MKPLCATLSLLIACAMAVDTMAGTNDSVGAWLGQKARQFDRATQAQIDSHPGTQRAINGGLDTFTDNVIDFADPNVDAHSREFTKRAMQMGLNPSDKERARNLEALQRSLREDGGLNNPQPAVTGARSSTPNNYQFCPSCGARLGTADNFCQNCGKALRGQQASTINPSPADLVCGVAFCNQSQTEATFDITPLQYPDAIPVPPRRFLVYEEWTYGKGGISGNICDGVVATQGSPLKPTDYIETVAPAKLKSFDQAYLSSLPVYKKTVFTIPAGKFRITVRNGLPAYPSLLDIEPSSRANLADSDGVEVTLSAGKVYHLVAWDEAGKLQLHCEGSLITDDYRRGLQQSLPW